ncbi:MAG TPA: glycerol kinase GlpK [Candidatus Sulfomarinibacteraceae bacterium]|nr:glycerol kinase GlpK [Candidatus Sulfomarinibacteraceae bacterium]
MTTRDLVLALDQGTTSSRAVAVDHDGRLVASAQQSFEQRFPAPGHVAHDPEAIWSSQLAVAREVVAAVGGPDRIAAIGITNQRETTIVWDRATGAPVADAIVWQSRITAPACERLRSAGLEPLFRERTGLPLDAYFSGPKIAHILEAESGLRGRAEAGGLAFGTVDSFLTWRLTGGRIHATDVSNASRTLLFDIGRLAWDDELLGHVGVPRTLLPEVVPTSGVLGETETSMFGRPIPIAALAGDQQAATFGQACFRPGETKVTYGTGAFLLLNVGEAPVASRNRLLSTVLWQLGPGGPVAYALEGSVFVAGAAVQWLRDGLRAFDASADVERLAAGVEDTGGVVVVPAFTGLGAPYWDPDARGAVLGITRGTGLAEIARATLDGIAQQVADVVEAMVADTGRPLGALRADGGAATNDGLLQFQADLLGVPVERPVVAETTALGAAYLAGLAVGFWRDTSELEAHWALDRRFEPAMDPSRRAYLRRTWARAVERVRGWAAE